MIKNKATPTEEEIKALQDKENTYDKSDYKLVKMSIPEWFCPVVCAGLELREVIPMKPSNNKAIIRVTSKNFRFKNK